MGCFCSKYFDDQPGVAPHSSVKRLIRPVWKTPKPWTEEELQAKRAEYWDTQPHYGGDRVIWDALKAAAASDLGTAAVILDSAGIVVSVEDMTVCYDERGAKYELPKYVLSEPSNLRRSKKCPQPQEQEMSRTALAHAEADSRA
ncbi:hypothetical protein CVIRNUC_006392 [Coccomyxa viridis]|uniref:DC-UbP/UBTD2 N-terminal domain-containing protein n=1 Tax=Coccomyxa viridis TaxID=1274662 RepID=A0AAV1IBI6_9CHLO|nr:hypothetical protein CVIRNUC_006392 [Coccomyxa viridis]